MASHHSLSDNRVCCITSGPPGTGCRGGCQTWIPAQPRLCCSLPAVRFWAWEPSACVSLPSKWTAPAPAPHRDVGGFGHFSRWRDLEGEEGGRGRKGKKTEHPGKTQGDRRKACEGRMLAIWGDPLEKRFALSGPWVDPGSIQFSPPTPLYSISPRGRKERKQRTSTVQAEPYRPLCAILEGFLE